MTDNFYLDSNPETFNLQLPTCKRISTTILTQLLSHLLPQCLSTPQQSPPCCSGLLAGLFQFHAKTMAWRPNG